MPKEKYAMNISLNVLNHLGMNLYSNIPAVLSEVVANAWDADAEVVDITIKEKESEIEITDNGHGMTLDDINNKYLHVGYERRAQKGEEITSIHKRPVMGRKGIGKLSLFSIAGTIKIQTQKGDQKNGFIMSAKKLKELLEAQDTSQYHPDDIPDKDVTISKQGMKLTLTDLKKGTATTASALRQRLARRFSIIGADYKFVVNINGKPIEISDRDYFHKIQYLWYYGKDSEKYQSYCKGDNLDKKEERSNQIGKDHSNVSGWIGSVKKSGDLQDGEDNLNKIVVMVRGKLAQEDILEDFAEGGMYTKYLIGEIHADFLDMDDKEDSATTSRQEIKKDDPRYIALKEWVRKELKHIQGSWTNFRNEKGTEHALIIPAIKEWFESLDKDEKKRAASLFGKINQLTIDSEEERRTLFKHGVLAFENFRYKGNLDALEAISPEDIEALTHIFAELDDIEATLYHQIVKERLAIIKALHDKVKDNALEKVIQKHLYEHLWLLDPSWDRATETPLMEQQVLKEFGKIDAGLSKEEKEGRFDIKYKTTSKKHIIIELKRSSVVTTTWDLAKQVTKYSDALLKLLKEVDKADEPIEVVCLVGRPLGEWVDGATKEKSRQTLAVSHVRVVMYQELIEDAYRSYQCFLDKNKEAGRIFTLVQSIEKSDFV